MPRKKTVYLGVEFYEPDTLHKNNLPVINFICEDKKLEQSFLENCKPHFFEDANNKKQLEYILKNYTKNPMQFLNGYMLFLDEISLSGKVKSSEQYLYHLLDYNGLKTGYFGFDDIIKEITKRVRNKHVKILYDGEVEICLYDENDFANILTRMTIETHNVSISIIKNNGDEDSLINITPLKVLV